MFNFSFFPKKWERGGVGVASSESRASPSMGRGGIRVASGKSRAPSSRNKVEWETLRVEVARL